MTESEYSALVRHMRASRTLTEAEAHKRERKHDNEHFTARERHAQFGG